jgi:excisionase family DNA binding protein
MATDNEPFVRVKEVAAYLRLSKDTIYSKVAKSEIPYYKIGTALRFKMSEIEALATRTAPTGE